MVRVFSSQKTEHLLRNMELMHWREIMRQRIDQTIQELSDNWKTCAIGERIKREGRGLTSIKDLSPMAIKLGYDFSVALQEINNEKALEIIHK